jgi:hypothetical protein
MECESAAHDSDRAARGVNHAAHGVKVNVPLARSERVTGKWLL